VLSIDRVTRSITTLNVKREKNHLDFLKSMPPIKKSAKLASGRETEVKRWLPLVRAINKNKRENELIDFKSNFFNEVIY
jgi:hypothetical protein